MKLDIKLPKVRCVKCGHTWTPRKVKINWCPKCMYPEIEVIKEKRR